MRDAIHIRAEKKKDWTRVHKVNALAFETPEEAGLVDMLREQAQPIVSLVAEDNDDIVGHIMFSPMILPGHLKLKIMGLAPMAVTPNYQGLGIGSELVKAGLEQCRQLDVGAVVVLGHPKYYPRLGLSPAKQFGIKCEYDVPDDVFMLLELDPGYLQNASGKIEYHAAFNNE
jgi:putative acetyltransferase